MNLFYKLTIVQKQNNQLYLWHKLVDKDAWDYVFSAPPLPGVQDNPPESIKAALIKNGTDEAYSLVTPHNAENIRANIVVSFFGDTPMIFFLDEELDDFVNNNNIKIADSAEFYSF